MKQALPSFIKPMLAQAGQPFDSEEHLFEIKWDGTRALAFIEQDHYRLLNRRQADMTARYPEFSFLKSVEPGTIIDGELIVLRNGKPDFGALQSREHARSALKIRNISKSLPATYVVFDLLYEGYESLLSSTLTTRRKKLEHLVKRCGHAGLLLSQGIVGAGKHFFQEVAAQDLEGIVAKRLNSKYLPGERTDAWVKIKRAELVVCAIIGFLPSGKDDFRSLILAAEENGKPRYVGKVGSGFDAALRKKINNLLWSRIRSSPIIPCEIKGTWIEPGLYCRVSCMERTAKGHLRAPSFKGLL